MPQSASVSPILTQPVVPCCSCFFLEPSQLRTEAKGQTQELDRLSTTRCTCCWGFAAVGRCRMRPSYWQVDFFHCYSTNIIPTGANSHWDEQELGVRHRPSGAKPGCAPLHSPAKPPRWGPDDASGSICSPWGRPRLTPTPSCLPRDAQHPGDQPLPPGDRGIPTTAASAG